MKLVSDWGRPWALYDLAADRTELRDLAPLQPAQAARLAQLWDDWAARAKPPVRSAGGEPTYRHLHDAQEKFVGGGTDTGDAPMAAPARKNKRTKSN